MLPHRQLHPDRRGDDRARYERGEPLDERGLARADPRDHAGRAPELLGAACGPLALSAVGRGSEERVESEGLEVDRATHDAERLEEPADPRLRREREGVAP